jgi:hypothetical protein
MFHFLETHITAGQSCIIDHWFDLPEHLERLTQMQSKAAFDVIEVQCLAPGPILFDRFARRANSGERHPGHCDHLTLDEHRPMLLLGHTTPLPTHGVLIKVDTSDIGQLDLNAVCARVDQAMLSTQNERQYFVLFRLMNFIKRLDLDSKLTLSSLLLMFVAWLIDYLRDSVRTTELVIPLLLLLMIAFFLLMLSETLRRERKINELLDAQQNFLRTEFPNAISKSLRMREDLDRLGITSVHAGRDDALFSQLLGSSSKEVCLMGISLYHYVSVMRTTLPGVLADKQIQLRVMLAGREAFSVKEKEREEGIPNRIASEIDGVCGMLRQIELEARHRGYTGKIEVRQYTGIPYCSLCIFDGRTVLYNPYLRSTPGNTLPVYEISNSESRLLKMYMRHFEKVWEDETSSPMEYPPVSPNKETREKVSR